VPHVGNDLVRKESEILCRLLSVVYVDGDVKKALLFVADHIDDIEDLEEAFKIQSSLTYKVDLCLWAIKQYLIETDFLLSRFGAYLADEFRKKCQFHATRVTLDMVANYLTCDEDYALLNSVKEGYVALVSLLERLGETLVHKKDTMVQISINRRNQNHN